MYIHIYIYYCCLSCANEHLGLSHTHRIHELHFMGASQGTYSNHSSVLLTPLTGQLCSVFHGV